MCSPRERSILLAGLFLVAALLRLHNAGVAPPLSGYDGPYHAAYVGILYFEGRLPDPGESWSTYHPALYYALCAGIWKLLPRGLSPAAVLFTLRLVSVLGGLALGFAVYQSARLLAPKRPRVALSATAVTLFLPMQIGPSSLIGNEMMAAALCGLGVWLLLRALVEPDQHRKSIACGLVLGLALLTKYTALAVVATAGLALLIRGLRLHGAHLVALRPAALTGLAVAIVSAPYFAYNLHQFDTPGVVPLWKQRDVRRGPFEGPTADVLRQQGYGRTRPIADYFSLDTKILRNPVDRSLDAVRPVWPVTFAQAWFDIHGTLLDPRNPWARSLAPAFFACGAFFSTLALVGFARIAAGREKLAVPVGGPALLLLTALALAAYLSFTHSVATFSALKGLYLTSGFVAFAVFTGLGFDLASRIRPWIGHALTVVLGVWILMVGTLYWAGGLAPLRANPAEFYVKAYVDAPTHRVFEFFVR